MDKLPQQKSFVKLAMTAPLPKTPQKESSGRPNIGSNSLHSFEHWAPDEEREARLELTRMVRNHPYLERNVKVERAAHSKIPSIFDHMVRNSSTIKSNYHNRL